MEEEGGLLQTNAGDRAMQQVWAALASCISAALWQGDSRFQSSAGPRLSVGVNLGSSLGLCDEDSSAYTTCLSSLGAGLGGLDLNLVQLWR